MALQTSGAISLNDIHVEVGGTSGTLCSLNDADFRALINVGNNANQSLQLYYGKSNEVSLPTGGSTVNGQVQLKEISASKELETKEIKTQNFINALEKQKTQRLKGIPKRLKFKRN